MSVNSSSPSNVSLPLSSLPSSFTFYQNLFNCCNTRAGVLSITAFTITSILFLLPLYILVLHLGFQRRQKQRSNKTLNDSDFFTYHMVFMELLSIFGSILTSCGVLTGHPQATRAGICLCTIHFCGQMYFHILTCVERYLAVVHPITYLSLRKTKGIRVRNITIGCVWLLSFAGTGLLYMVHQIYANIIYVCVETLALIVISFCSLPVLCVLTRPGPGEGGGGRQQIEQSKLRAFYTVMVILGVLLIRFGQDILSCGLYVTPHRQDSAHCGLQLAVVWFGLPSSLVLPLLFLHRAGKLPCCKNNNESGFGTSIHPGAGANPS